MLVGVGVVVCMLGALFAFLWTRNPPVHRALLVGDSLMYGAQSQISFAFGVHNVATRFVGGPGTGPLDGNGWWADAVTKEVDQFHPDVVVIEACCNYDAFQKNPYVLPTGAHLRADTPQFYDLWTRAAKDLVARASAKGARVFWVVTPPADPTIPSLRTYAARIQRLNDIYIRLDNVRYVDWARVLAPHGFSYDLKKGHNAELKVRDDGLHLTPAGSLLVAGATWNAVAPHIGPFKRS